MAVRSGTLTRRQRARITRGVQYVLFVAAILVLASLADWGQIRRAFFDLEVVDAIFPQILTTYLVNTVTYTAAAFAFGLVLGLVLALMRLSSVAPYRWLANIYIEFFRGVPALLVILARWRRVRITERTAIWVSPQRPEDRTGLPAAWSSKRRQLLGSTPNHFL